MSSITHIEELVRKAQSNLDATLIIGGDTTDARATLREAEAEMARIKANAAEEASAEAAKLDALDEAIADAVEADYNAAKADLQGSVDAILADLVAPTIRLYMDPLHRLVLTGFQVNQARAQRAGHLDGIRSLADRRATLHRERAAIVERRAGGYADDEVDGPRLALLDADIQGLDSIIERARAMTPPEPRDLEAQLVELRAQWEKTKADALLVAVHAVAHDLEARLLAAAKLLRNNAIGFSTEHRWRPSAELAAAIRNGIV